MTTAEEAPELNLKKSSDSILEIVFADLPKIVINVPKPGQTLHDVILHTGFREPGEKRIIFDIPPFELGIKIHAGHDGYNAIIHDIGYESAVYNLGIRNDMYITGINNKDLIGCPFIITDYLFTHCECPITLRCIKTRVEAEPQKQQAGLKLMHTKSESHVETQLVRACSRNKNSRNRKRERRAVSFCHYNSYNSYATNDEDEEDPFISQDAILLGAATVKEMGDGSNVDLCDWIYPMLCTAGLNLYEIRAAIMLYNYQTRQCGQNKAGFTRTRTSTTQKNPFNVSIPTLSSFPSMSIPKHKRKYVWPSLNVDGKRTQTLLVTQNIDKKPKFVSNEWLTANDLIKALDDVLLNQTLHEPGEVLDWDSSEPSERSIGENCKTKTKTKTKLSGRSRKLRPKLKKPTKRVRLQKQNKLFQFASPHTIDNINQKIAKHFRYNEKKYNLSLHSLKTGNIKQNDPGGYIEIFDDESLEEIGVGEKSFSPSKSNSLMCKRNIYHDLCSLIDIDPNAQIKAEVVQDVNEQISSNELSETESSQGDSTDGYESESESESNSESQDDWPENSDRREGETEESRNDSNSRSQSYIGCGYIITNNANLVQPVKELMVKSDQEDQKTCCPLKDRVSYKQKQSKIPKQSFGQRIRTNCAHPRYVDVAKKRSNINSAADYHIIVNGAVRDARNAALGLMLNLSNYNSQSDSNSNSNVSVSSISTRLQSLKNRIPVAIANKLNVNIKAKPKKSKRFKSKTKMKPRKK